MTLKQWYENGWLRPHTTTRDEIENLFEIVDRDLKDARSGVSADWRFGIAYNAALKLCTILLYAEGYKAERNLQHYRTIQTLPKILGPEKNDDTNYLDTCRAKRNTAEYDSVGVVDESTEHSQIKAQIVSKYFWAWANVISSNKHVEKIAYIDLFTGPGRYKDGTKSTPLLILEKTLNPIYRNTRTKIFTTH